MHRYTLDQWRYPHQFTSHDARNERNTTWVVILTVSMMVMEIGAGMLFGSMALLADGWHMGTHAAALGITLVAYIYARRLAKDSRSFAGHPLPEARGTVSGAACHSSTAGSHHH